MAMTRDEAEKLAARLWSDDSAVGQVRWRRSRSPRFWVGVLFSDGRSKATKGESNVDWESAFAIALNGTPEIAARLASNLPSCGGCGRLTELSDYGDERGRLCVYCVGPRLRQVRR